MNSKISLNFSNLKKNIFLLPVFLLLCVSTFLNFKNATNTNEYIIIQKDIFMYLNGFLSKYPKTLINLTEFGNVLIIFSFLTLFLIYAPKMWEALITASLISAVLTFVSKKIFAIPRPAAFYGDNITVIGNKLTGFNSFPSGHSITVFTTLTIIFYAFMPQNKVNKLLWFSFIFLLGSIFVITRVGIGAHHPLDALIGSILGYLIALFGIFIDQYYSPLVWIKNKNIIPYLIGILFVCAGIIFFKIITVGLLVFYFALISLVYSIDVFIINYAKK